MNLKMLSTESQAQKAHSGNPISIHFGKGKTIVAENRLWGPGVKDGEGLAREAAQGHWVRENALRPVCGGGDTPVHLSQNRTEPPKV